jgi:hypothetical protein
MRHITLVPAAVGSTFRCAGDIRAFPGWEDTILTIDGTRVELSRLFALAMEVRVGFVDDKLAIELEKYMGFDDHGQLLDIETHVMPFPAEMGPKWNELALAARQGRALLNAIVGRWEMSSGDSSLCLSREQRAECMIEFGARSPERQRLYDEIVAVHTSVQSIIRENNHRGPDWMELDGEWFDTWDDFSFDAVTNRIVLRRAGLDPDFLGHALGDHFATRKPERRHGT